MKKLFVCLLVLCMSTAVWSRDAKDYIADLNKSKDEKTIIEAADWLGKEKEKDAIPALISLLSDDRENVRVAAATALGYIGDEKAVEALNSALLNDKSSDVRYAAILSTYRIGSKKSLEAWKKAKETEQDPIIRDFLAKMEEKARGK